MKDPKRLLESETEIEASLLGSAAGDAPREGLDRRVHAALGLGGIAIGAGTTASVTAAAATSKTVPILVSVGIAKWGAIAVVGAGLAAGSAAAVHRIGTASHDSNAHLTGSTRAGVGAIAGEARLRSPAPVSVPDIPAPPTLPTTAAGDRSPPPPTGPATSPMAVTSNTVSNTYAALEVPPSNPPAPPAEPKTPPLEDEVALVHQAHSALASGDTPRALAILDRHDLDYIHGALAPEALEVRIEAYVQRHDETKVAELAQAFLSRYPGHPLTGKVRSLLGKGPLR